MGRAVTIWHLGVPVSSFILLAIFVVSNIGL
jgi:hypothetical protein